MPGNLRHLPEGYYFWDTEEGDVYREGGRYKTLREIERVDTSQFYRTDYGEPSEADNSLAIGYSDGNSFYNVDNGMYRSIGTVLASASTKELEEKIQRLEMRAARTGDAHLKSVIRQDINSLRKQLAEAKKSAAALPGTPRIAAASIDLYNGELIYVQSDDDVEGLYCLPEEEDKYLDQGMRRISVQEEAWWYRETPASPEEVPQWYGPFETQEEAQAEIQENIPDANTQMLKHQKAAAQVEKLALQAVKAHMNEAEAMQDSVLGELLGVPAGYSPNDDQVSVF